MSQISQNALHKLEARTARRRAAGLPFGERGLVDTEAAGEFHLAFADREPPGLDGFPSRHGSVLCDSHNNCQCPKHRELSHNLGMTDEDIGARLREARIARGYKTAEDAAEALDLPYATYAAHENGSRGLTKKTAPRYASFFRINTDWLLSGRGRRDSFAIDDLPPDAQAEVLNFIEYTRARARAKHPK